jgi:hypothetical protein
MELYEVIASLPGWETKTASELVGLLNSPTVEVRDDQLYTWAGVADNIDSPHTENLKRLMETSDLSWATIQLGGKGLPLSHPGVQAFLTQFVAAGVPGASTLKAIGIHRESPAQHAGLPVATLSDVESAVDWLTLQTTKQQMRQDGASRYNAYVNAIDDYDGSGDLPVL